MGEHVVETVDLQEVARVMESEGHGHGTCTPPRLLANDHDAADDMHEVAEETELSARPALKEVAAFWRRTSCPPMTHIPKTPELRETREVLDVSSQDLAANARESAIRTPMCQGESFTYSWADHQRLLLFQKMDEFRVSKAISRDVFEARVRILDRDQKAVDTRTLLTEGVFPVTVQLPLWEVGDASARAPKGPLDPWLADVDIIQSRGPSFVTTL